MGARRESSPRHDDGLVHRLPQRVNIISAIFTGCLVAITSWCMSYGSELLSSIRSCQRFLDLINHTYGERLDFAKGEAMERNGPRLNISVGNASFVNSSEYAYYGHDASSPWDLVLPASALTALTAGALAGAASLLVLWLYDLAVGSGLPEIKGYLNLNQVSRFTSGRNWVRTVAVVLAHSSGLVMGMEGPLVCIGGCIGMQVSKTLAAPFFRRWARLDVESLRQEMLILDQREYKREKRIGCIAGGAAGLAVAFNAPVGGVLYMFEEAGVFSWSPTVTFRAAAGAAIAAGIKHVLITLVPSSDEAMEIYGMKFNKGESNEIDVPFIVMLAIIGGMLSAMYTWGMLRVWELRRRARWRRKRRWRVLEAAGYAFLVSAVFSLLPAVFNECSPVAEDLIQDGAVAAAGGHGAKHPAGSEGAHGDRDYIRYTCAEGYQNGLATLLQQPAEAAMKILYDRDHPKVKILTEPQLLVCLAAYAAFAIGMGGLSVPAGNFVPSMFMGAVLGRLFRQGLGWFLPTEVVGSLSHRGLYSMCGSAAVLAGFTHMTVAIVALLTEAWGDINICKELMLSACVGLLVKRWFIFEDYCEELIMRKGVPFLGEHPPQELSGGSVTVGSACVRVPAAAELSRHMDVTAARAALDCCSLEYLPLLDDNQVICTGLVPRERLQDAVLAAELAADTRANAIREANSWAAARARREGLEESSGSDESSFWDTDTPSASGSEEDFTPFCGPLSGSAAPFRTSSGQLPLVTMMTVAEKSRETGAERESSDRIRRVPSMLKLAVGRLAEPAPHSIPASTLVSTVYPLFLVGAVDAVCVLPSTGPGAPRRSQSNPLEANDDVSDSDEDGAEATRPASGEDAYAEVAPLRRRWSRNGRRWGVLLRQHLAAPAAAAATARGTPRSAKLRPDVERTRTLNVRSARACVERTARDSI